MAYWLFCQSCQQWSKSATPLSEDKVCPFCSDPLMKVRGSANNVAGYGSAEESAASVPPITVEVPLETVATREAEPEQELDEAAEVNDQSLEKESEPTSADVEEPASDAGSGDAQDEPTVDLRAGMPEETETACEDEDDLVVDEESGEAKTPEADNVKVSEVRVITDQSEKKDRLAKKTRR